jgi:hypothetical protein
MNERTLIAVKLIGSHLGVIAWLVLLSTYATNDDFLVLSITQTALGLLYFAGYWEFFGLRFKKFFCAFIEVLIVAAFAWKVHSGSNSVVNVYQVCALAIVQAYLLVELIKIIIVINKKDRVAADLEFPFRQGTYLVTDGGNSRISRLMNYHYYSPTHKKKKTNNSMLYATDIVKLAGKKPKFLPKENEAYPIFNEMIYCPMDGVVVKVENSIPDHRPFAGNYPYNTGNTVVVRKDQYYLLLGHIRQDTILVKEGDRVQANDPIGAAGNSGWTERPHLHMQLIHCDSDNYWLGTGVCIRYRHKNLYKNRVIKQ